MRGIFGYHHRKCAYVAWITVDIIRGYSLLIILKALEVFFLKLIEFIITLLLIINAEKTNCIEEDQTHETN